MQDNKKAPENESQNKIHNFIIPENPSKREVLNLMPIHLSQMIELLMLKHINAPLNSILNIVLPKTAQMITSKKVTLQEVDNKLYPNYYAIVFMSSGFGKDRILSDIKKCFFKNFKIWFDDKANDFLKIRTDKIENEALQNHSLKKEQKAYIKEQTNLLRDMVMEITNGTQEGVFEDAKVFQEADFGCLFTVINELGLYLKATSPIKEQFLGFLYEAYDGIISSKSTKGDKRLANIESMPVNALLYSDHTLFKNNIKYMFENLMLTGLCRRSVVTFFSGTKLKNNILSFEDEKELVNKAENLNKSLFNIFLNIDDNACFVLEKEAKDDILNVYSSYLTDLFNNTDDEMLKKEIKSRELKALKLSCLYACLNHPKEHIINSNDIVQAITSIQALSKDFKAFITYKPKQKDKYDHIFEFFLNNIGKEFKKVELTNNFHNFGFTRRKFQAEFDEIINFVSEIAKSKNFFLHQEPINNNSGMKYCLKSLNSKTLIKNAKELSELI